MIIKGGFLTMGTKRVGLARIEALLENLKREISWGIPDGTAFGGCIKHVKIKNETCVVASADSIVSWTQPAGTVLNAVYLAFPIAPVLATGGDIGIEIGTSSSGNEIVNGGADEALDNGTTIAAGAVIHVPKGEKPLMALVVQFLPRLTVQPPMLLV